MTSEDRKQWYEQEVVAIELEKDRLADAFGLERNDRFNLAWSIAWEFGHASGVHEVANYFIDLIPLIKEP